MAADSTIATATKDLIGSEKKLSVLLCAKDKNYTLNVFKFSRGPSEEAHELHSP